MFNRCSCFGVLLGTITGVGLTKIVLPKIEMTLDQRLPEVDNKTKKAIAYSSSGAISVGFAITVGYVTRRNNSACFTCKNIGGNSFYFPFKDTTNQITKHACSFIHHSKVTPV